MAFFGTFSPLIFKCKIVEERFSIESYSASVKISTKTLMEEVNFLVIHGYEFDYWAES